MLFISHELLVIVVCFAAGIGLAATLSIPGHYLLGCSAALLVLLFIIYKVKAKSFRAASCLLMGLLFFLLGLLQHDHIYAYPTAPSHINSLITKKQTAGIDGILEKYPAVIPAAAGPQTRLLLKAKALQQPAGSDQQRQHTIKASGLVLLTLNGELPDGIKPGDRLVVKANVAPISTYSTPGSFNYKNHLASQAVFIKGWIPSPHNIIKLQPSTTSLPVSIFSYLRYLPERIRTHIAGFLDQTLSQPARGLYKAILIGDRYEVPAAVLNNFTAAGCIHILAISGMHMGLLAMVIIALLSWILKRSIWLLLHAPVLKIAVSVALVPLLIYAFIAGFNIPVLRALLMTIIFILATLFDRPGNLINHILLAALLILAWKPAVIFSASFQLSFSAVTAIALIYPLLHRFLCPEEQSPAAVASSVDRAAASALSIMSKIRANLMKWLLAGIALTTAAMLGTIPLLLFHFNRFSLVAPLSNLLVEPLICFWALLIGLAASVTMPFLPGLAKSLFLAGSIGLTAAERICAVFALFPYSSIWFSTPLPMEIILSYFILLSLVAALYLTGRQSRQALMTSLFFSCLLLATEAMTDTTKHSPGSASVVFLDVGHGSATLLRLEDNKTILIDGGGAGTERFDVGARIIAPFLWKQKISRLDAVVVTHPHADHYNGLPFILTRFRPKTLWVNGISGHEREYQQLLDLAGRLGIETRIAGADETLFQAGAMRLICLQGGGRRGNPPESRRQGTGTNPNDASLVLRLETGSRSFLFPGDISSAMAEILAAEGRNLQADVLLAPHHGSPSSMSQTFIETVAPEYVVISVGRNNPFNFPARSFYDLQQKGMEILTTDRDGTTTFTVADEQLTVSSYQIN